LFLHETMELHMAFLQRKKRKKGIFRTRRFSDMLRRNTESVFSKGNKVALFKHGGDFLPSLLQSFRNAAQSIRLEFYMIKNDGIGKAFADELLSAVDRGVEVSLIYDYIGCIDTPSSYFKRLEEGGVCCLPFNKPAFKKLQWLDMRDHRKVAVIDGKIAFLGGLNIGDEYAGFGESPKRWRDLGVRLDGPVVGELLSIFRNTWRKEAPNLPIERRDPDAPLTDAGDAEVMIVNGAPHHNRSIIRSAFRMAIAGASERIRIVTPYFIPGPRVVRSLLRAVARGVRVQIVLPAISDVPLVRLAGRAYLAPLLRADVEIYERQGTILHAKVMLVDDRWVTIGSANLDYRSFHRNYELNVIVDSYEFGFQVNEMINEDIAKSRRITLLEHEARSWIERLLERLCDPIRRFL
jgi:cardiolipin synthase